MSVRLALIALPVSIWAGAAQAQAVSNAQTDFAESANQWRAALTKNIQSSVRIVLPPGLNSIESLPAGVLVEGRQVIATSTEQAFKECADRASKAMSLDGMRAPAEISELKQLALVAVAKANGSAAECQRALHVAIQSALNEAHKKNKVSGFDITIGDVTTHLTGDTTEPQKISQLLAAYQFQSSANLVSVFTPFIEKYIGNADAEKFVSNKVPELRQLASAYIRALPEHISQQISHDQPLEDVRVAQAGLNTVIGVAFKSNPKLSANLTKRVNDLAKVAQVALVLGSATNPAQAALLSFSGSGALSSLFGSGGGDGAAYDKLILDQVSALREDIQTLRGEMHERFDAIDRTLASMLDLMTKRFDKIDQSLGRLSDDLNKLKKDEVVWHRLEQGGLTSLLSLQVDTASLQCFDSFSADNLSPSEYGKCLVDFVIYSTKVAKVELVSGAGRIGSDPLDDVSRAEYSGLSGSDQLGYLVFLDATLSHSSIDDPVASPVEWGRGAKAYIELLSRWNVSPQMRGTTLESIVKSDQANIKKLISEGARIKQATLQLRKEAFGRVAQLYEFEFTSLTNDLGPIVERELARQDLGITTEQRKRTDFIQVPYNGSSSLFRACGRLWFEMHGTVPPIIDASPIITKTATDCRGQVFTNKSNEQNLYTSEGAQTRGWPDNHFSLQVNVTNETARAQLQTQYIKEVPVTSYPSTITTSLSAAISSALKAPEFSKRFLRMQRSQKLLLHLLLVGREEMTQTLQRQVDAVVNLPTSSDDIVMAMENWAIRQSVSASIAVPNAVNARIKPLLVIAEQNPQLADDKYPFVDNILTQLTPLRRDQ